ncbi:hypothetical protein ACIBG8_00510 [Nonomuraea sp. NPDC050556]|uniref:hypothetical protein n=1 Tax=Nonomuraea sp. NPDC050556 TaxID=3364369 RepID=UPI0037BDE16D
MNPHLGEAYHRLDQDARDYTDAGRALGTLRARRRRRAVVAGVLAIALGVGVQQWLSPRGDGTATVASAPPSVPAIQPPADAPPLPVTGPVGRGALVYTACQSACPTFLVLTDGTQRLLGQRTVYPPGNITLSPDGRWLGRPVDGGYEVRDLLGSAVHHLEPPVGGGADSAYSPWAWSADSRRLIAGYHASGNVSSYVVLDLSNGVHTPLSVPEGQEPVGLLPSGAPILLTSSPSPRNRLTLQHDGKTVVLTSDEGVFSDTDHGVSIQVYGESLFVLEYSADRIAVLTFNADGKRQNRVALSADEFPVGPVAGGFAIIRLPNDQARGRQQLESVSPTGRIPLFDLPGQAAIVLPGGTRH